MAFVAGMLHHHRNPKLFQLVLYLRRMVYHSRLYGQSAVPVYNLFVVRSAVFPCIGDQTILQGFPRFVNIPPIRISSRQADMIQSIQSAKKVHSRSCHKINVLYRLLNNSNILTQSLRRFFFLRNKEKLSVIRNGDQSISVLIIIHRKLCRIFQFKTVIICKTCQILFFSGCLRRILRRLIF